jgi:hypothetical protein
VALRPVLCTILPQLNTAAPKFAAWTECGADLSRRKSPSEQSFERASDRTRPLGTGVADLSQDRPSIVRWCWSRPTSN